MNDTTKEQGPYTFRRDPWGPYVFDGPSPVEVSPFRDDAVRMQRNLNAAYAAGLAKGREEKETKC